MSVTVAIVSYNVEGLLGPCLESVKSEIGGRPGAKVVVVDNASTDGSVTRVRRDFPEVVLIENQRNAGFGAACNQALVATSHETIVFLNPDAELQPGALDALTHRLKIASSAALVGPLVTFPNGAPQETRRRTPSLPMLFIESTPLEWRFGTRVPPLGHLINHYRFGRTPPRAGTVPWLSGACLAARTAALVEVGGFDPHFFMYFEELDLARRLKAYGWSAWYEPAAVVWHHSSQSADQDVVSKDRNYYRSKYRYVERYHGRTIARALSLTSGAIFALEHLIQRRRRERSLSNRYRTLARAHLAGSL